MQRIAVELKLDPLEVIQRNLVPNGAVSVPHRRRRALDPATIRPASRPRAARAASPICSAARGGARRRPPLRHRLRRRGRAERVEHGLHHDPADARGARKAGPKNGAQATATVNVDPVGAVSVTADVTVQGQGIAPCCRRSSPTRSGSSSTTSTWCPRSTPPRTSGRSPPATIRAGSRPAPRWRRISRPSGWPRSSRAPRRSSSTCCRRTSSSPAARCSRAQSENALPFGRVAGPRTGRR